MGKRCQEELKKQGKKNKDLSLHISRFLQGWEKYVFSKAPNLLGETFGLLFTEI